MDVTCLSGRFGKLSVGAFLFLPMLGLDSVNYKNKTSSEKLILTCLISCLYAQVVCF